MSEQHTPTPWRIFGDENHIMGIDYKDAERMRVDHSQWTHNCTPADAQRIVDCVNFCDGISSKEMKTLLDRNINVEMVRSRGKQFKHQRDELLAAFKQFYDAFDSCTELTPEVLIAARDAIAKVENGK